MATNPTSSDHGLLSEDHTMSAAPVSPSEAADTAIVTPLHIVLGFPADAKVRFLPLEPKIDTDILIAIEARPGGQLQLKETVKTRRVGSGTEATQIDTIRTDTFQTWKVESTCHFHEYRTDTAGQKTRSQAWTRIPSVLSFPSSKSIDKRNVRAGIEALKNDSSVQEALTEDQKSSLHDLSAPGDAVIQNIINFLIPQPAPSTEFKTVSTPVT